MASIKVRQLPDWVLDAHRSRAAAAGRSLEEELRRLLTETALERQRQFAAEALAFRERLRIHREILPDSTPGIAQDRQERG